MKLEDELIAAYREGLLTRTPPALSEETWLDVARGLLGGIDGDIGGPALLVSTPEGTRRVELAAEEITLGRDSSCTVCLPHRFVSRVHCQLSLMDGHWVLEDLGSSNGTLVNGVGCPRKILVAGDVLQVGEATLLFLPAETGVNPESHE